MSNDEVRPDKPIIKKRSGATPSAATAPKPGLPKESISKRLKRLRAAVVEAVRSYLKRGWLPIPLCPGEKRPVDKGWQKSRIADKDVEARFPANANVGVLTGAPSGQLVDLDLDWPPGLQFADEFFPPTHAVFGRASKPGSHRLYVSDIPKRVVFGHDESSGKTTGPESKPFAEIRSTGGQTMFPPSVHPSGERVRWEEDGSPEKVDAKKLLTCARDYSSACLLGMHWPGVGSRNEAAMAAFGFMLKWGLTLDRAKLIVFTAGRIAGDEEIEQRVAAGDSTKAKIDAGEPVIAEGAAEEHFSLGVMKKLRAWLDGKSSGSDGLDDVGKKKVARPQADELVELAADFDLFTTPGDGAEGWATVAIKDRRETFRLRSRQCRSLLTSRYWQARGRPIATTALDSAFNVLQGRAVHEGSTEPTAIRVATDGGRIYVDIGDKDRQVVEVSPNGWRLMSSCPIRFVRPQGQMNLPLPTQGGSLESIRQFVNVEDADWILFLSWLVYAFHPNGPYPILALNGGQGSAKSTTTRVCKRLTDPSKAELRSDPRDARDLAIAAQNGRVLTFDNLSGISNGMSDSLCRLATGGVFSTRLLYSDDEEVLLEAKRPLIINGIPDLAVQPDLIDRSIHLVLPAIRKGARMLEDQFWASFDSKQGAMLGALLDAVSAVLGELPNVQPQDLPRMADFARWGMALERHIGASPGTFLRAYEENRNGAAKLALEETGIVKPLRHLLAHMDGRFQGSASDLLEAFQMSTDPTIVHARSSRRWPRSANALSGLIRRLSQSLDKVGLRYEDGRDSTHNRTRFIVLELTSPKDLVERLQERRASSAHPAVQERKRVVKKVVAPIKKGHSPKTVRRPAQEQDPQASV